MRFAVCQHWVNLTIFAGGSRKVRFAPETHRKRDRSDWQFRGATRVLRLAQIHGATIAPQDHDRCQEQACGDCADDKPETEATPTGEKIAERGPSRARGHDGEPLPELRHLAVLIGGEPHGDQNGDEHGRSIGQPKSGFLSNPIAGRCPERACGQHGNPIAGVRRRQRVPAPVTTWDANRLDTPQAIDQQHRDHQDDQHGHAQEISELEIVGSKVRQIGHSRGERLWRANNRLQSRPCFVFRPRQWRGKRARAG